MTTRFGIITLVLLLLGIPIVYGQADGDGIPDNCEYRYGTYYQQNIFPRYEPQNQRLVLVDWATGSEIRTLATGLGDTIIQGWSANCQYLAVAVGDFDERATTIFDTLNAERIGAVGGAYGAPHRIHWGPGEYLIVESREGAVLWDVPRNIQYRLDTGFNTTTYRNFDTLRWDAGNNQLVATLSVGGRRVYDLNTGSETISATSPAGMVALGGNLYPCQPYTDRYTGRRYAVAGTRLIYNEQAKLVSVGTYSNYLPVLETLEAGIETIQVRTSGWSANCRYVAGSLLVSEYTEGASAVYDTVVWDVQNKRRVGTFEGARGIPHPVGFDTAEKHMMIQTRDGAYLWNLETDTKLLVNETVEPPPFGCRHHCRPRSFHSVYWDAGREQFLGVPVQEPNTVLAYDVNTAEVVDRYTAPNTSEPLRFITSNDSRYIAAYGGAQVTLWDRADGRVVQFDGPNREILVSPDSRYLVMVGYSDVLIWDINTLADGAAPMYTLATNGFRRGSSNIFVSNRVISNQSSYAPQTINIESGEVIGNIFDVEAQSPVSYTPIAGLSGYGGYGWYRQAQNNNTCALRGYYNGLERKLYARDVISGGSTLVAEDVNTINPASVSPDCRFIYGNERNFNTDVPYRETGGERDTVYGLWNIETGEKIVSFAHNTRANATSWSPQGDRSIVFTSSGAYLVQPDSGFFAPLTFLSGEAERLTTHTYWDYERGMVYVGGCRSVYAFDMTTGEERVRFSGNNSSYSSCHTKRGYTYGGAGFTILEDGWIAVHSGSTGIWNMDTLEHVYIPMYSRKTYLSPDRNYVVMALSDVYVWDFQTGELVSEFGVMYSRTLGVEFVDNNTIEVTRWNAEATGEETALYDIITGTPIN